MLDEIDGVIKYKTQYFKKKDILNSWEIADLEYWREILFSLHFIGEYSNGIGFGNISKRRNIAKQFIITATQTGKKPHLSTYDYTLVEQYCLETFSLGMSGQKGASSEALTHAAIYEQNPQVNYIFHIHHRKLWERMIKENYDAIGAHIQYGTKEMAKAFQDLTNNKGHGIIVMKGHQDGILAYGKTAQDAGQIILKTFIN